MTGSTTSLRPALLVTLLIGLLAACGTTATDTPAPGATESPAPAATFTGGTASANLNAPEVAKWTGGWCVRGKDDTWLAVNIGDLNGQEYFGLVVGADPHGAPDTDPVAGGGTFSGNAATVTWRHAGARFVVPGDAVTIQVASDLRKGTFGGRLADGREVRGSFACP